MMLFRQVEINLVSLRQNDNKLDNLSWPQISVWQNNCVSLCGRPAENRKSTGSWVRSHTTVLNMTGWHNQQQLQLWKTKPKDATKVSQSFAAFSCIWIELLIYLGVQHVFNYSAPGLTTADPAMNTKCMPRYDIKPSLLKRDSSLSGCSIFHARANILSWWSFYLHEKFCSKNTQQQRSLLPKKVFKLSCEGRTKGIIIMLCAFWEILDPGWEKTKRSM